MSAAHAEGSLRLTAKEVLHLQILMCVVQVQACGVAHKWRNGRHAGLPITAPVRQMASTCKPAADLSSEGVQQVMSPGQLLSGLATTPAMPHTHSNASKAQMLRF